MTGRKAKKLRYLDSKGILYSNGITYEGGEKYLNEQNKEDYSFVKNYGELQILLRKEEQQYEFLKNQLNLLQKQRDLLQWHICNNVKKLSMKRSENKFKEQCKCKLEEKLKLFKDKTKIHKFEHDTLEEDVNKMEQQLDYKIKHKANVETKFNKWMDKKNEYLKDLTYERRNAFRERNNRQNQLKKLLLVVKQEENKNYNMDYLKKCEINLMNELSNHKNYKKFDTSLAITPGLL
ncbi:hypothetical protein, conserved [Plasmodium gonderi]|uniref:Uncharacterized protein n=1 Tax=Plasmodium gonderi TaxID=77519 RepID=A0A1Y1JE11_PLAGO|nr:hypothetical protein, conserved [Plasmodium gonderi]GAW79457.1 hypothetical protein, conserved [Plasmodium gonderi]